MFQHNTIATIFDIQGLSVHDGPGCRTLIFLNGCSLHCFWCSNPEGINKLPSIMYFENKCIMCEKCIENCTEKAISIVNGKIYLPKNSCNKCVNKTCINECYTDALKIAGKQINFDEIYAIIKRDRQFWGENGGITLTGGEPLLQIEFAQQILKTCYDAYVHTAIETCGNIPWANLKRVLPYLDWVFFDLKHMDTNQHKNATGADNTQILSNAKKIAEQFKGRLIFRLPLIPYFNESTQNIETIIAFLKEINKNEINILPVHHFGRDKYKALNKKYFTDNFKIPTKEKLKQIKKLFTDQNINCYVGSDTPF